MPLGKNNRYIQVKVSSLTYDYLKQFSKMFGTSISNFCSDAVTEKIIRQGALSESEIKKEAGFINSTYEEKKKNGLVFKFN